MGLQTVDKSFSLLFSALCHPKPLSFPYIFATLESSSFSYLYSPRLPITLDDAAKCQAVLWQRPRRLSLRE